MMRWRIQIGDGEIKDTLTGWGLIPLEADKYTEAPAKERTVTAYAEEPGEHVDPRTVQAPFDYTATFLIETPNRNFVNANSKIAALNKAMYTQSADSDIRTYREMTLYNDRDRVKIVGIPSPIAQPKEFYRRQDGSVMDCVIIGLKIRVSNPVKCNFDMALYRVLESDDGRPVTTEAGVLIEV